MHFLKVLISIIVLLGFIIISAHYVLLRSNKGYYLNIGGGNVLSLGVPRDLPKSVSTSFTQLVNSEGDSVYLPKFEHNVIIQSEKEGDLYTTNVQTQKHELFTWSDETSYICLPQESVLVNTGEFTPVALTSSNLASYKFIYSGSSVAGVKGPAGFFNFRDDFAPDSLAKLIVKSETPNKAGELELLNVILFTNKKEGCFVN